jgi:hypothetical protein
MRLLCVGDIAFSNEDNTNLVWTTPAGIIPGDEIKILFNWELPNGKSINPIPRVSGPRIVSQPDSVNIISRWVPGFAALATNHILDSGEEGLANTINSLQQRGFITVGAGMTQADIAKPLFWDTKEGKLAIVNWVFPETNPDWMCVPGPNCWPGIDEARRIVRELKQEVNWVIVFAHWSDELFPYPRPDDRRIARELADMGADMVIGHHPHVVRGMEIIGSCPIFYSLGNFYFSDISDGHGGWVNREAPRNREGLGVQISFHRWKNLEYRLLPFWHIGNRVILDPLSRAARMLDSVSRPLREINISKYSDWYAIRRNRFNHLEYQLHFRIWHLGLQGLFKYLIQRNHF